MTIVNVNNKWCLKQDEMEILLANGMGTKTSWWLKNMTTGQFVNYQEQIGTRIRGDQPFVATLELEPGEYMGATGNYQTISSSGRHCSQVFYIYVDENGGQVCKKSELPSQGGTGTPTAQTGGGWGTSTGGWSTDTSTNHHTTPVAPKEEYFVIPNFKACMQDLTVKSGFDNCDDCDMVDYSGNLECANCRHALDVYVKKQ